MGCTYFKQKTHWNQIEAVQKIALKRKYPGQKLSLLSFSWL